MSLVRTSVLIAAPVELVFDLARDVSLWGRGLAHLRARLYPPGTVEGLVSAGDRVSVRVRYFGVPWRYDSRVSVAEPPARLVYVQEHGPWRSMRHEQRMVETGAGTLLVDELSWQSPFGVLGRAADALLLRRHLRRLLLVRDAHLRQVAEQEAEAREGGPRPATTTAATPATPATAAAGIAATGPAAEPVAARPVVVGVALVDDQGRVLAARRREGGWEFPGGKVEPGESERDACVRECQEELGVRVEVAARIDGEQPTPGGALLRLWTGHVADGTPTALVHATLRWLTADELTGVEWLPADRPFLPAVAERLRARSGRP